MLDAAQGVRLFEHRVEDRTRQRADGSPD
jgi:hypothetical protein